MRKQEGQIYPCGRCEGLKRVDPSRVSTRYISPDEMTCVAQEQGFLDQKVVKQGQISQPVPLHHFLTGWEL